MKKPNLKYRILKDKIVKALIIFIGISSTIPLLLILYYIIKMGISSLSWDFFVHLPNPPGESGGGVANAIVGTLMLIFYASLLSIPIAIAIGIYLSELRNTKFASIISAGMEILQGVPSVVIGILAYVWVVKPMGGFSAFSGSVALAIMMLPIISKSTEETLKLIPHSLREASVALGVPYSKTILKVIVPSGLSGILTGILLSVARVAGETAPLLFTAFGNPFMNLNVMKPVNSLPLMIYNYAGSPYRDWHELAWGASLVLAMIVLLLNFSAKLISRKWKIKF